MAKRNYLLLIFQDPKKDKLEPYGEDLSKLSDTFDAMRQKGGPDGIVAASIVTSTGRVVKHSAVYPKAWHAEQAKKASEANNPAPVVALESETPEAPAPLTAEQIMEKIQDGTVKVEGALAEFLVSALEGTDALKALITASAPSAPPQTGDPVSAPASTPAAPDAPSTGSQDGKAPDTPASTSDASTASGGGAAGGQARAKVGGQAPRQGSLV